MDIRRIRAEMRMGRSIFDLPLRVTFYARVSTDQDEQLNSLENQVQYYTELIKSKKNWTFVPGYIDEGISGTTTRRRDDFNRSESFRTSSWATPAIMTRRNSLSVSNVLMLSF